MNAMKTLKSGTIPVAIFAILCAAAAYGFQGSPSLSPVARSRIVGGPFVVRATSRTATVAWVVQSDEVQIHPSGDDAPFISPALRMEKTTLTGLRQNTRYDYSIASGGGAGK